MDFEQLRIFLVLAEERTFLGAAKRLGTSRSRVRRKLDQLESDAATALLVRGQNGLGLTPAGESLARRGRALLDEADHLIAHVHDVGNEPTGCLRVAMPVAPPPTGWAEITRSLQTRFTTLQIDFLIADVPEALIPTRADIALSFSERPPPNCRALELGEFDMRLVASERYARTHGVPSSLSELREHHLGLWRSSDRAIDAVPLRRGSHLSVRPRLVSDDPVRIQRSVLAGDVIGYLPALPALDDPALKILFADEIAGRVQQRLFVPEVLADVPRVARFVELCRVPGALDSARLTS